MKHVLMIYTGGTIGMTRTDNGYAPRSGYFRAALDAISDLHSPEMPSWDFMELSPLLDSSNMTVHEWNRIAELIAQQYDNYDGFVVLQAPAGLGGKVGEGAEGRLDQRDGIIGDDPIRRIEYLYSRVLADAQGQAGREIAFWLLKIPPDAERRQTLQQLRFLLRIVHKDTVIAETVYGNSQAAIFRQHDLPRPEPAEQAQPHHQEDSKQDHKLFGAHGSSHPFSGHAGREVRYRAVYRTFSSEQTV